MENSLKPKLSIVIPAFNEEKYLPKTLDALNNALSKVHFNSEIIVVDNNSTDRTASIAESYGAIVVFEEKNQIARARNAGAKLSKSDYLLFLDADTLITKEHLIAVIQQLDSGKVAGGGCKVGTSEQISYSVNLVLSAWNFISRTQKLAAGSFVYVLRDAWKETGGFDEEFYASEEIWFSKGIKDWAKPKDLDFVILNIPVDTSIRKLHWYSPAELALKTVKLFFNPVAIKTKEGASFWYDRPEDKK
jgi:glycosyltransferase involved in cell wall biosynthesis